jgi:hypothetical protein
MFREDVSGDGGPLQKVNVHLTIWTAGRRYWRKLE